MDFEVETESKWLNIFNKHGDKSTLKYRRELTPNIEKSHTDKICVRNDLFEQVIRSCKATNAELMFKEKLGTCLYEENYFQEEIIKIQAEEAIEEIVKVSTKNSTKALIDESDNESINESDNKLINESDNKSIDESINESDNELIHKSINESDNKSIEKINKESKKECIEHLKEATDLNNSSTTNWYDKNKFNKILTTIDSNNFNHRNKIGEFKFMTLIT